MTNTSLPPYQRIAESIRHRIEQGELAPGARVPSTRALAKKWRVALATAAHALTTLTNEGWVVSVPRVGSVVAQRGSKREPERSAELSQARIVTTAIALADAEGIAALSLRGVAARMGVPVTSLYRHVDGKDALLMAMTDAALSETSWPATPPPGWRAQLEVAARLLFSVLRRHPWLARVMHVSRPRPLGSALVYAEWTLRALEGHGLSASVRMNLHIVLYAFVQGMAVNLEAEADAQSDTGLSEDAWMHTQLDGFRGLAESGAFPAFGRTLYGLDGSYDLDMDALFETGLALLLDGFAARFAARETC